jgi:hypothetical protein
MSRGLVITALLGVAACRPGLPVAEHGTSTGTGTTDDGTETGGLLPCEPVLLEACRSEAAASLSSCVEACACDDLTCVADCHAAFETSHRDCVEQHCRDPRSESCEAICDSTESCEETCDAQRSSCTDVDGCDVYTCDYQWQHCNDSCFVCVTVSFAFTYAGGCEIVLPGPAPFLHLPYVGITIGAERWALGNPGPSCDDPEGPAVVWADGNLDRLLLCDPGCDAFASLGAAEVEIGCPGG